MFTTGNHIYLYIPAAFYAAAGIVYFLKKRNAAMAIVIAGSAVSDMNFGFFASMNDMRLQNWMAENMSGHWLLTWWLPLLLAGAGGTGGTIELSYLNSVSLGGYHLQLDMMKPRQGMEKLGHRAVHTEEETCNKSEVYHIKKEEVKKEPGSKLFLLAIRDPGLYVILTGFAFILLTMTWYYILFFRYRNNR